MSAASGPQPAPAAPAQPVADVAVIGAGVVGSAIARELAGYELSVTLLEARADVGDGTSKANTAILHTGFDAKPGTLESRLVCAGYHLLSDYASQAGIPVERTGALLVAWDPDELAELPVLKAKAAANGYDRCEVVDAAEVYRQIPDLGEGALGGLTVPDESITCTWTTSLALATDARIRGTDLRLAHPVRSVSHDGDVTILHCDAGDVPARWVVNAAGLGCDLIDQMFGYDRFHVTPRRGELLVFDKLARPLVNKIVLPVPTARGKGVLISPTIYGNVMLGPTAEDLEDRTATGTSEAGYEFLLGKGRRLMPRLLEEEVTASYAGLRAAVDAGDYLIKADGEKRYVLVGGIRSTGLTSAMAIAEHVRDLLSDAGLKLTPRSDVPGPPRMPNIGEAFPRPYADEARIASDPAYGRIVCFCERVTAGEIRDACGSPIPPADLGGLRRRTRAMNGRCQGFFCAAEAVALFEQYRPAAHATSGPQEVPG
jgi:glycerol-3-phosphate dehydrogenase